MIYSKEHRGERPQPTPTSRSLPTTEETNRVKLGMGGQRRGGEIRVSSFEKTWSEKKRWEETGNRTNVFLRGATRLTFTSIIL